MPTPRLVTLGLINSPMEIVPIAQRREELLRYVAEAGAGGCQIVMMPEFADHHRCKESLTAHGKGIDEVRKVNSLTYESPWMKELSALAKKYKMVVIADVMLQQGSRWSNTAVVYGPEGTVLGGYSKSHVAPGEDNYFDPGNAIEPIETPFGRLGLLICYDINFIELTRCYEMKGADLLLWTTMRQGENEEGLYRAGLPARALIHGLPFGVSTYVGNDQHLSRNPMSSILYNCFGQVIAGGRITPGVLRGTVDISEHPLERRTWSNPEWLDSPSYLRRQRRPDLYGVLVKPLTDADRDTRNEPVVRSPSPDQMKA
jgi:predicted amidohydrolase